MIRPTLLTSRFLCFAAAAVAFACTNTVEKKTTSSASSSGNTGTTGRRDSVPCKGNAATMPIEAFDVVPDEAQGKVCDLGDVLDQDGNLATIVRPGAATHKIAGRDVTGCVAVEFSDGVTLSSLVMKMRPVSGGCGHPCAAGGSEGCGTGWKLALFVGASLDKIQFLQQLSLTTSELFEYRVAVHKSYGAKFAIVCRDATPASGDDVGIDLISGLCQ